MEYFREKQSRRYKKEKVQKIRELIGTSTYGADLVKYIPGLSEHA